MLIAQITDLHLGFGSGGDFEDNAKRLRLVVKTLNELAPRPDLVLATGDLTDHGDLPSYKRLKKILDKLAMPVLFCMGNHDNRDVFRQVYPNAPFSGGFNQYAVDNLPLRILVLDTLETGRHGGGFDEPRAAWLEQRLAESDRPTLVVMHHPPIDTGIEWMTIGPSEAWVARLEPIVARHNNIVAILAGHVHRPIISAFGGTTVRVCPSTQPQVVLDLDPMNLDNPDDRPMIVAGPPGIGLHWWNGKALVSHYTDTDEQGRAKILARYTVKMQGFLKHLAHERAEGSAGH
ncbi:MAG: metallophosphoesterase [Caulobacter sp.]|nr:metallophosphoesterase [Caulobacter sp.]